MSALLKIFEANEVGRDFVIGDLHGSFEVFLKLLEGLKFDDKVDRMFSVGDLVDRGPNSVECLRLLSEPWFHCVRANHEEMMIDGFDGGYLGQIWLRNGGMWGLEALNDWNAWNAYKRPPTDQSAEIFDLVQRARELPFLITVKLKSGERVHVIHAELPPHVEITDEILSSEETLSRVLGHQSDDGEFFTWGRRKFYQFFGWDLQNNDKMRRIAAALQRGYESQKTLSRVVSGHTKVQRPLTVLGQTNIDTAAHESYLDKYGSPQRSWGALTCIELNAWKFYQATERSFSEVQPVVVNTESSEAQS